MSENVKGPAMLGGYVRKSLRVTSHAFIEILYMFFSTDSLAIYW